MELVVNQNILTGDTKLAKMTGEIMRGMQDTGKGMMRVAKALFIIKEESLYKQNDTFTSFEDYCNNALNITLSQGNRLVKAYSKGKTGGFIEAGFTPTQITEMPEAIKSVKDASDLGITPEKTCKEIRDIVRVNKKNTRKVKPVETAVYTIINNETNDTVILKIPVNVFNGLVKKYEKVEG